MCEHTRYSFYDKIQERLHKRRDEKHLRVRLAQRVIRRFNSCRELVETL